MFVSAWLATFLKVLNMCDSTSFTEVAGSHSETSPLTFGDKIVTFQKAEKMALEKERHVFCGSTALVLPCSQRNAAHLKTPKSFNLRP